MPFYVELILNPKNFILVALNPIIFSFDILLLSNPNEFE